MTLSVLAVDDSRTMRGLLQKALTDAGFDVSLAEDGQHGLEVLEETHPHVIITDINMPRLNGFGFIEGVRAREQTRATPILVLTTESAAEMKIRAKKSGATGWIVKPFEKEKLVSAILRVSG